jgi:GTP-binding protein
MAAYPFTTLHPQIGVIDFLDERKGHRHLLLADIPGLIEGANENRGLGHRFLRHIERCAVLVLIIDMAGTDARDPRDDYKHLLNELKLYDPALLDKPRLVAANKMDVPESAALLTKFKKRHKVDVIEISCREVRRPQVVKGCECLEVRLALRLAAGLGRLGETLARQLSQDLLCNKKRPAILASNRACLGAGCARPRRRARPRRAPPPRAVARSG